MTTFYAGQKDYIAKLNTLALAQSIVDIPANSAAAAASAAEALVSENAASTSASEAATSKTDADTAKTAAQEAQAAAELALDAFDDRYLGSKASNPTLDNDGNALLTGALYFNTVAAEMRVWTGTLWQLAMAGSIATQLFSGTGAQVAFTLAAEPLGENNTQVYVFGVYQQKDTYSLSGAVLTFSEAPPVGTNNIEVVTSSTLALGTVPPGSVTFTSSYNGVEPLKLGGNYDWIDTFGMRRTKSSAPAGAVDGNPFGLKVEVPALATSSGAPGQWSADTSFYYTYSGDGTTHSWRRVAVAAW